MNWTNDNGMLVSDAMPIDDANAMVASLEAEGREASWAVDNDDRTIAYVWLSPEDAK